MKVHEAIKWISKLPADSDVIINWWDLDDLIAGGGRADLTYDEWKHLVNRINGKEEWTYIYDLAIEESHDIVAQREDLFKDKSG